VSNEADSFVHEVDEKLREERMMALAKRYGPWLIGLFALFIVGLGGWQGWLAGLARLYDGAVARSR
jgi:hypothetical protein